MVHHYYMFRFTEVQFLVFTVGVFLLGGGVVGNVVAWFKGGTIEKLEATIERKDKVIAQLSGDYKEERERMLSDDLVRGSQPTAARRVVDPGTHQSTQRR